MNLTSAPRSFWACWTPSQADWLKLLSSTLATSVTKPTLSVLPSGAAVASAVVGAGAAVASAAAVGAGAVVGAEAVVGAGAAVACAAGALVATGALVAAVPPVVPPPQAARSGTTSASASNIGYNDFRMGIFLLNFGPPTQEYLHCGNDRARTRYHLLPEHNLMPVAKWPARMFC